VKEIPLTQGHVALVDDDDYAWLSTHKWHALSSSRTPIIYAVRTVIEGKKHRAVLMHREIAMPLLGFDVDHRDHDGLNNQRKNLRVCTASLNMANRRKHILSGSQFKGVTLASEGRWRVRIQIERRPYHIGYFATEEEAARAYDRAAAQYFGSWRKANFPKKRDAA